MWQFKAVVGSGQGEAAESGESTYLLAFLRSAQYFFIRRLIAFR
jgi:hypothetical protein